MKFCKNLQRVVDISDPEWAPFWMNYKMLKTLIKESNNKRNINNNKETNYIDGNNTTKKEQSYDKSSKNKEKDKIIPNDEAVAIEKKKQPSTNKCSTTTTSSSQVDNNNNDLPESCPSLSQLSKLIQKESFFQTTAEVVACLSVSKTPTNNAATNASTNSTSSISNTKSEECNNGNNEKQQQQNEIATTNASDNDNRPAASVVVKKMESSPTEVSFFKHLHVELRKCVHFFKNTEEEFKIREERIRMGINILTTYDRTMCADKCTSKWSSSAKSLYRLYKDLLLLETYAIMTYCSFSKILKKHDKVTNYSTRSAFMSNIVSKTNFSSYPTILHMISRVEDLYEQVTMHLASEGRKYSLQDDERLFINTIHKLNEQVIVSTNYEHDDINLSQRRDKSKLTSLVSSISSSSRKTKINTTSYSPNSSTDNDSCNSSVDKEKSITSSLKLLVEENENKAVTVDNTLEDDDHNDNHDDNSSNGSIVSVTEKRKICCNSDIDDDDDESIVSKRLCTK